MSRSVVLELPNANRVHITPEAKRLLLKRGDAWVDCHSPLVLKLRMEALPRYRRIFRWTTSSTGYVMTGAGLMNRLPRPGVDKDFDQPELWRRKRANKNGPRQGDTNT